MKNMDDIDKAKIGKKDEKLVGWDFIRKPKLPESKLPPMKAKNALLTLNAIRYLPTRTNNSTKQKSGWFWYIVILGVMGIIIAKFLRLW